MRIAKRRSVRWAAQFLGNADGTAAIEFAFIAPVLIAMTLALVDVAAIATGASAMQTAVHSGIQYVLIGGSNLDTARNQVLAAWPSRPGGATVTTSQSCKCGATASACTAPCADGTAPASYVSITATASLGGTTFSLNKTTNETVRVR